MSSARSTDWTRYSAFSFFRCSIHPSHTLQQNKATLCRYTLPLLCRGFDSRSKEKRSDNKRVFYLCQRKIIGLNDGPWFKNRCADSNQRSPLFDGDLVIVAHPHREVAERVVGAGLGRLIS